jgi:hypothetical protein
MQAVTCFHCANEVKIAPDACLCPQCGEDLQHLLLPETVVGYFQARAYELSEQSELSAALVEAERGLTYADSSELHLLAAIIAKQLGRFDRMRQHVAAIPVDDTLRSEAEWLLRSHQDRERALQAAAQSAQASASRPASLASSASGPALVSMPSLSTPANTFLEDLLGGQTIAAPRPRRNHGQAVASVAIVVLAVTMVAASWWWIGPGALRENRDNDLSSTEGTGPTPTEPTPFAAALPNKSSTPTQEATLTVGPVIETVVETGVETAVATLPAPVLLPTATPTPVIPDNLVQAPTENPEVADSNPRRVLVIESNTLDLKGYLEDQGYSELASLPVEARIQDETLLLQGIVNLDSQRRQLIEITQLIPGIRAVNAVDLLLRPLPTYVVQEGDTLWLIVYNIYGNVDRLDEFAAYNFDVLPEPDALAPGITLKVLPIR